MKFTPQHRIVVGLIATALFTQLIVNYVDFGMWERRSVDNGWSEFCSDIDKIKYIQKKQLRSARLELFNSDQRIFNSEQTLFYDHNFGSVVIDSKGKNNEKSSLVYYRIWKNGNDNIREHLRLFSQKCNVSRAEASKCSSLYSIRDSSNLPVCFQSCKINTFPPISGKPRVKEASSSGKFSSRFAFTFVREPISRFISGYTEVEYRMKQGGYQAYYVPLYAQVGTQERFREFIRMILKSDASKALLNEKNVELPHISPQIGSILQANKIEPTPITLYKLEEFDVNWKQLSMDSGHIGLSDIHNVSQLIIQPTSNDPLKTTLAARTFLASAESNDSDTSTETPEQRKKRTLARLYLRAICRIYLVDFVCGNYDLPDACTDLELEITQGLEGRAEELKAFSQRHWLRYIIPNQVTRWYAEALCMFSAPQCVTDFLHGKDSSVDID